MLYTVGAKLHSMTRSIDEMTSENFVCDVFNKKKPRAMIIIVSIKEGLVIMMSISQNKRWLLRLYVGNSDVGPVECSIQFVRSFILVFVYQRYLCT